MGNAIGYRSFSPVGVSADGEFGPQPILRCEDLGASPLASGSVNTSAINQQLANCSHNGGGLVTLTIPGTYNLACQTTRTLALDGVTKYSVALIFPSNVKFSVGAGVTLRIDNGSVVNPVMMQNLDIVNGNSNIVVEGYGAILDGNASQNTRADGSGGYLACIMVWFQTCTNIRLRGWRTLLPKTWNISFSNCNYVWVGDIWLNQTGGSMGVGNHDGISFQGPNSNVNVNNISGTTYDDMIVIDPEQVHAGYGGGTAQNFCINGLQSDTTTGVFHFLRCNDSTAYPAININVSNVNGYYVDGGAVIGRYIATSVIQGLNLSNWNVSALPGSNANLPTFDIAGQFASINISNVTRTVQSGEVAKGLISCHGGQTARSLQLSNIEIHDLGSSAGASWIIFTDASTSVDILNVSNAKVFSSAGHGQFILLQTSATLRRLNIDNFESLNLNTVLQVNSGTTLTFSAHFSNMLLDNSATNYIYIAGTVGILSFVNVGNVNTSAGGSGLIRFVGSAGTPLVQFSNCAWSNGANPVIARNASETIRAQGDCNTPVDTTILTPVKRDMVLDSTALKMMQYDGTTWQGLY